MLKTDYETRVKEVEESIEQAKSNKKLAEDHIEEGEILLEAFKKKIETFK